MAIIKCKMCGGELNVQDGMTVAECEYCGTKQTVPTADNEKKMTLFARANRLRAACEFDKAGGVYESIVAEFPEEAEAYWGLLLCKYGIEYVDDPATGKKIPTCHRSSFDSIMDDSDFEMVMEYSDPIARRVYREEAKAIEELRKGIVEVSCKEEPYDIFICYKETDENGNRTIDSVIAQDIYKALTDEGYRVFFARISLEDKLGTAYEPYIFAALNSAKVMLAVGTDYEHYNAVWVKNEWSRFLALIAKGEKKTLIPCYKDIDAYDIPKEFKHLQAQDMGKVGAMQDLVRGIGKLIPKKKQKAVSHTYEVDGKADETQPLLKRMFMCLEDSEWDKANEYSERVLDKDPENAEAYLGKLMTNLEVCYRKELNNQEQPFDDNKNYIKTIRFADTALKNELIGYIDFINNRNAEEKRKQLEENRIKEEERNKRIYSDAVFRMKKASAEDEYKQSAKLFRTVSGYKDAVSLAKECEEKAEASRKDTLYSEAVVEMQKDSLVELYTAKEKLDSIKGWKDADDKLAVCETRINELTIIDNKRKTKRGIAIGSIVAVVSAIIIAFVIVLNTVIIPNNLIIEAKSLAEDGHYLLAANNYMKAGLTEETKPLYWNYSRHTIISAGWDYTVGLKSDGTHTTVGDYHSSRYSSWIDIIAVSAGYQHTVGLKADGTVIASGYNDYGQCNVSEWKDIVAVSAGGHHTVGLKADGTVVAVGENDCGQCDVQSWTCIVAVSAGGSHTVGIKSDGTVVATKYTGDSSIYYGQCDVSKWANIVAVSAGSKHTVGLKEDGTVVAVGDNENGECNVLMWKNITAIAVGSSYTIGLKANGTAVAVGENYLGDCDVSEWNDIVAIAAGNNHTVGLKSNGTVVALGSNISGQCNVKHWKLW